MSDLPFTRCPFCGAVDWPPRWTAVHRRNCPNPNAAHRDSQDAPAITKGASQ